MIRDYTSIRVVTVVNSELQRQVEPFLNFLQKRFETKIGKDNYYKYYLAYSGGKDSHFLYWFIKDYLQDVYI